MPALGLLGGDIIGIVRIDRHMVRDPLGNRDSGIFQPGDRCRPAEVDAAHSSGLHTLSIGRKAAETQRPATGRRA